VANLNSVMLIGRLTADPELRSTPAGVAVCRFRLATNHTYKKADGEKAERTCFVDVEAWRRLAELCAEYLKKGREVFVGGRLTLDQWQDKSGSKRSRLSVTAQQIQFLSSRRRTEGADGAADAPRPGEAVGEPQEVDEQVGF
jgi:single-strand DNA-binding protein